MDLENKVLNFLDIETTGLRLNRDRVIEVYISKEFNGKTLKTYHTLINPGFIPDRFILKLTNIPLKELQEAPYFEDVADEIYDMLDDGILVAHNARFDYSFLKAELANLGKPLNIDYCCTVKMFKNLHPEYGRHNLDTLRIHLNSQDQVKHRAENDTQVLKDFYYSSLENHGADRVRDAVNYSIKKSAIPETLLNFDFNSIPEQPGVYIFYGKEDYPLYVGMSNNLRRRVRDHLYSDTTYSKDSLINQQLTTIKTIPTAGVLGAALRESYLVKKLEPMFNRKLRRNDNLVKLLEVVNEDGYKTIVIDTKTGFDKLDTGNTLLVTRSVRSMKDFLSGLVKENGLCSKLLGLEKTNGRCFSSQLGYCKGACHKKISVEEYNQIFDAIFAEYKVHSWPYDKPIVITEEGYGMKEELLLNNWLFLGSTLGEGSAMEINKFSFNLDTYKIISGYLFKDKERMINEVRIDDKILHKYLNFF